MPCVYWLKEEGKSDGDSNNCSTVYSKQPNLTICEPWTILWFKTFKGWDGATCDRQTALANSHLQVVWIFSNFIQLQTDICKLLIFATLFLWYFWGICLNTLQLFFAIFFRHLLILAGFCSCYGFSVGHYWQQWDVQCAMSIFYREMMFSGKDGRGDKRWKCEHRCLVYNIYLVIGWSWFTWFSWFRESAKFTMFVWFNSTGSLVILV